MNNGSRWSCYINHVIITTVASIHICECHWSPLIFQAFVASSFASFSSLPIIILAFWRRQSEQVSCKFFLLEWLFQHFCVEAATAFSQIVATWPLGQKKISWLNLSIFSTAAAGNSNIFLNFTKKIIFGI